MDPVERGLYIHDLFEEYSYVNFIRLVDLIFDPQEEQGRMPLFVYAKSDLDKVTFEYKVIADMLKENANETGDGLN